MNRCEICKIKISRGHTRCRHHCVRPPFPVKVRKLWKTIRSGANNPNHKHGSYCIGALPRCKVCGKQLKRPEAIHCKLHANRIITKSTIRNIKMKKDIVRHHIFGKQDSRILLLPRGKHYILHHSAYFYILEHYGKAAILDYIKWFNRKWKAR